jgi:GDP-mannose 6-dehydrogenase
VDIDARKVALISAGRAPFIEDRLQPILQQGVASGRLTVTADLRVALMESSIAMVCLNTGARDDGGTEISGLLEVVDRIAELYRAGEFGGILAVRSTVPPGTFDRVLAPGLRSCGMPLVANPEFLREGSSVKDFMAPSMIVIGGENAEAIQCVGDLYASLPREATIVGFREAEVIKSACNTFHALKVAFANEVGRLCGALGIDGELVMRVLSSDDRLNASAAYLKPGFAFGGCCLPKDMRTLNACAANVGVDVPLLKAILPSNAEHLRSAVDAVLESGMNPIGVYGIAFKKGTDDLRGSPALAFVRELARRGLEVQIFDPTVNASLVSIGPIAMENGIEGEMSQDIDDWLRRIEGIVLTQGVDGETMARLEATGLPVMDLSRGSKPKRSSVGAAV